MTSKRCSRCNQIQPLDRFIKDARRPDGRGSWCRRCQNEVVAQRDAANPGDASKRAAAYAQRNRAQIAARARRRRRANPDRERAQRQAAQRSRRVYEATRRARRRTTDHGCVTPTSVESLVASYGGRCAYCLTGVYEQLDHITPLARGGAHCIENLAPACEWCNKSKGALTALEFLVRGVTTYV